MSNKVYDIVKFITTKVLPAIGMLYFALAKIWHLPYGVEILGTICAVMTAAGVVLGISTIKYTEALETLIANPTALSVHDKVIGDGQEEEK